MELNTSAVTGAMRVGVQIMVAKKRPVLEIYYQLRNQSGPEVEFDIPSGSNGETRKDKHRFSEVFVELRLINIGGERAENVTFDLKGSFERSRGAQSLSPIFKKAIRQFSSGQSHYLMKIDQFDLLQYEKLDNGTSMPTSIKKETLDIKISYDGPNTILNKLLRFPRRLFGKKQYHTDFCFDPQIFEGDLPPIEYA